MSPCPTDTHDDRYSISALQYGMLLQSLNCPDEGAYVQQKILTLREEVEVSTFEGALLELSRRHPVLRTTFDLDSPGWPVQAVQPHARIELDKHDWRDLPAGVQQERMRAFLKVDRRKPFDFIR